MTAIVNVKGVSLNLNGTTLVVPPLTLGALQQLQDRLAAFTGGLDSASIATVIDVALAALRRNYPELNREALADMIDVANMVDVMQAVMDVSGMRRKAQEEADAGEPSTGTSSMPT
ncbi:hypothetical protein [Leeia sp.]|uniref:hypothetical protein n=1 Tax=Leeia sp. TaxID=2884678 RepID=UPI0035B21B91